MVKVRRSRYRSGGRKGQYIEEERKGKEEKRQGER